MNSTTTSPATTADRRGFMLGASKIGVGAIAAAAGLSVAARSEAATKTTTLTYANIPGTGDVKVINYALALEALETDLYIQAYQRLTTGGTNSSGVKIPGLGLKRTQPDVALIREFANVELNHRNFLDRALGSASLLRSAPFNTAKFNFNIQTLSRQQVINLVYTAELTGTKSYLGAIPFFTTKTYLQTAGAIQGTEARHTAALAFVQNKLFGTSIEVAPSYTENHGIEMTNSPNQTLAAVSGFIVLR